MHEQVALLTHGRQRNQACLPSDHAELVLLRDPPFKHTKRVATSSGLHTHRSWQWK
jgi:hypothetical protein